MKNVAVKKSRISGKGVFSSKNFREGEVILEIDDSYVVSDPSRLTKEQHEFELDYLADGKIVIMQVPEKYMNHSCDPNSYVKTVNGIRKVFAMRDIQKGEEIVGDYSINGHNEGTFKCRCGSKNCRLVYQGNFFKLPKALQKKYLPYLDDWFVEQFKDEIVRLWRSERVGW
jgi:SET domain-containing protein